MKISVIVPIYNVAEYLPKCIESILGQTYKDLEIILVNDGSTDNSGQIAKEFATKDSRIILINKANGGQSTARNAALDIASGDYIAFIDSDDYISQNYFEVLMYGATKHNAEIVTCSYDRVSDTDIPSEELGYIDSTAFEKREALDIFYRINDIDRKIFTIMAWCKLFHARLFKTLRFPVGRLFEDIFVAHVFYHDAKSFAHVNGCKYYYIQRATSTMGTLTSKKWADQILAYQARADFLAELGETAYHFKARESVVKSCLTALTFHQNEEILALTKEKIKENGGFDLFRRLPLKAKFAYMLYKVSRRAYIFFTKKRQN